MLNINAGISFQINDSMYSLHLSNPTYAFDNFI